MPGQIISRGERRWLVRIYLGEDATGKRRYHNHTVRGAKIETRHLEAIRSNIDGEHARRTLRWLASQRPIPFLNF